MDEQSALYVLQNVMQHFVSIVTEEAKTLPDEDGMWGSGKGRGEGREGVEMYDLLVLPSFLST